MKQDLFPVYLVAGIFAVIIGVNIYSTYKILKLKDDLIEK